jgi:uncharacterized protein YecE (DUF72 family)
LQFGKVDDIKHVDWSLPEDDPHNRAHLGGKSLGLRVHYGAPAWSHKAWQGKIYPDEAKRGEFLFHYSRFFNAVELNTSHYRIPGDEVVAEWLSQVPPGFQFCPKIYQGISHTAHGLLDQRLVGEWINFLTRLGGKCGPSFLQLPPYFDYSMKNDLFVFLKNWPSVFRLSIELRHPSWFEGRRVLPALTDYLHTRGVGLVITDVAGRRDVLHSSQSDGTAILRFVGNKLHSTDFTRAQAWADRIAHWRDIGLRDLYLFVHEPDDASVPEMAIYFLEQLCQRGIPAPRLKLLPQPQLSLPL